MLLIAEISRSLFFALDEMYIPSQVSHRCLTTSERCRCVEPVGHRARLVKYCNDVHRGSDLAIIVAEVAPEASVKITCCERNNIIKNENTQL